MNPEQQLLEKAGRLSVKLLQKYELLLGLIIFLLYSIQVIAEISLFPFLLILMMVLMIAYFFSAYSNPDGSVTNKLATFLNKVLGYGSAIAINGILFRIANWPGSSIALKFATMVMILGLLVILIMRSRGTEGFKVPQRVIYRILVLTVVCILLLVQIRMQIPEG